MENFQKDLLGILSCELFGHKYELKADTDFVSLLDEANKQAVYGICFSNLRKSGITQLPAMSRMGFTGYITRNAQVEYGHYEIGQILDSAGIDYVTIKGCNSSAYYPEPFLRGMGDVDFLIKKEDVDRCSVLLEENGFFHPDETDSVEKTFFKDAHAWELHWDIKGIPENKCGERLHEYLENIIDDAVVAETGSGSFKVCSAFHHGLVMIIHCAEHMTASGIGLRHLCDWAVFVNHIGENEFLTLFEDALKSTGLWHYAMLLTQLSTVYLGMPEQSWAMSKVDNELLQAVIEDIFQSGNFGHKDDENRTQAGFLISNNENGKIEKSILKQFVLTANAIVRERWPVCEKIKILYPIGWLYWGIRYFILSFFEKKRSSIL